VVSAVEHSAVLHAAEVHERSGGPVTTVGVDRLGCAPVGGYEAAMAAGDTSLACLQSANHEVGTLQPVDVLAQICRDRDVPLFVDAAQSVGRLPLPAGWALLSASAHKWGGPPGVGVLAARRSLRWRSPLPADERGFGRVPGFENVPAILAAATSLEVVTADAAESAARLSTLVDRIRTEIPRTVPDVEMLGDPAHRLPHLVTFSCLYVSGERLISELDRVGYAVNSGSSCTSSTVRPSHVLKAMGVLTHGNVRVSLPRGTTEEDVDGFLAVLPNVVARLRAEAGASEL
jgi:cysteine desulfurase